MDSHSKDPVLRKAFPFRDANMTYLLLCLSNVNTAAIMNYPGTKDDSFHQGVHEKTAREYEWADN